MDDTSESGREAARLDKLKLHALIHILKFDESEEGADNVETRVAIEPKRLDHVAGSLNRGAREMGCQCI